MEKFQTVTDAKAFAHDQARRHRRECNRLEFLMRIRLATTEENQEWVFRTAHAGAWSIPARVEAVTVGLWLAEVRRLIERIEIPENASDLAATAIDMANEDVLNWVGAQESRFALADSWWEG